jgi:hypothetical protein
MFGKATEGASNPILPIVGEVDLSAQVIIGLFVGLMLVALIRPASENAADAVANLISNVVGINPQTGQTGGNTAPVGGA